MRQYCVPSAALIRNPHARGEASGYLRAVAEDQSESLADMVRSFLDDDEVALLPQDLDTEHRRNTWSYSVAPAAVDVVDVVAAFNYVAAALRQRFASHVGVATFYAWYDEQAGQLRCSLSSLDPGSLPFDAAYATTDDAADVARLAAKDPHPGEVFWSDLVDVTEAPENHPGQPLDPFPVWSAVVKAPDDRG
jgi:hypothetical protein